MSEKKRLLMMVLFRKGMLLKLLFRESFVSIYHGKIDGLQ